MTLQDATAPAESLSRTERYERRLLEKLASIPDDLGRANLLSKEHVYWIAAYERFEAEVARGVDHGKDGPTAFDYTATIAVIGALKSRYGAAHQRPEVKGLFAMIERAGR